MIGQVVYKSFSTNPDYFVLCEKGVVRVVQRETTSDHEIGEFVQLHGALKRNVLYASSVELLSDEKEREAQKEAAVWTEALLIGRDFDALVEAPALEKMKPVFRQAAEALERAVIGMQPILVRFDEDADGITSALYLQSLVEHYIEKSGLPYPHSFFKAFQSEAPIFEKKHLQHLEAVASDFAREPLVVLLDHGGNEESFPALKAAKALGWDLMLVDHHPPFQDSLALFDVAVHPAQHGGSSAENTGLLMYHVASAVFAAPASWAHFAMQGDRSPYALKKFFKEPIVLDYASLQNWPLKKYRALLSDKNQVDVLYQRCLRLREESVREAFKRRNVQLFGSVNVQWLDISYLKSDYPPKGGVVQGLHEHVENEGPLVTVGFDKERVIFRANAGAEEAGFKANAWISDLKKRPGIVASGGGHARAASMRLKPGKLNAARSWLEERFKKVFGPGSQS
ncbi:hypothetical protein HY572_03260 [Candidatus Micrarchaeota archaeon]|nr:hypothetical protein [Candidatus Micrarchaeota archaeon]